MDVTLPSNRAAPAAARASLARLSDSLAAPDFHDLRVVVTELVTNAVRFGDDPIRLRVSVDDAGVVHGAVIDGGAGGAALRHDLDSMTEGLGLLIVDAICDDWGTVDARGTVWFELSGQPLREPSSSNGASA